MSAAVLIIEDDVSCAKALSKAIRKAVDVTVLCVAIPDSVTAAAIGIDSLYDHRPSVVIVDGLDGYAVEILLAASDLEIPAILYTGAPESWKYSEVPVCGKPDYKALLTHITKYIGEQES